MAEALPRLFRRPKRGKEVVDREVENAMLKRALGYEYEEVTQELVTDKDTGVTEMRVTKRVTKQIVPDVTAQIFWLKIVSQVIGATVAKL